MVKNLPANARDAVLIPEWEGSPEEEMATRSSIFAWEIPWAEKPGRLQSMGLQRVRCNQVYACVHTRTHTRYRGVVLGGHELLGSCGIRS